MRDRFNLAVVSHPDHKEIAHWEVGNYVIGRGEDVDIYIPSPRVSRHHAIIQVLIGTIFINDLGSSNGTFVDGRLIHNSSIPLQSPSRIIIGSYPATFFCVPEELELNPPIPVLCLGCRHPHHPNEPDWLLDFEHDYATSEIQ
jgi:hypothetical protein